MTLSSTFLLSTHGGLVCRIADLHNGHSVRAKTKTLKKNLNLIPPSGQVKTHDNPATRSSLRDGHPLPASWYLHAQHISLCNDGQCSLIQVQVHFCVPLLMEERGKPATKGCRMHAPWERLQEGSRVNDKSGDSDAVDTYKSPARS